MKKTYTQLFAWLPIRMSSGQLLWLQRYYIRAPLSPNDSDGTLFNHIEYILDSM